MATEGRRKDSFTPLSAAIGRKTESVFTEQNLPHAPPMPAFIWSLRVRRTIQRKGEWGLWVGRPREARGNVSRFGHLVFPEGVPTPRRVEVLPYGASRRSDSSGDTDSEFSALGGADVRVGLGTSGTLSGTVNPDFGQVELDPAVLNLTVFETFFPEKRPFFLEDGRTFLPPYGLFRLFHSRRIGTED